MSASWLSENSVKSLNVSIEYEQILQVVLTEFLIR